LSDRVHRWLAPSLKKSDNKFKSDGRPEFPSSLDYLQAIDHQRHLGYSIDWYGIDLNYSVLKNYSALVDPSLFDEVREKDQQLDNNLQYALGAKYCTLKAFYPEDGFIGWHTNWDAPGYNIIFTYSGHGNGYWRHIDSTGARQLRPESSRMVQIADVPGWHCKVGYFGTKSELDRIVWHCAYTKESRLTVSYVVPDKAIWENMVEDIQLKG
jgi:hypothetical protein